ncbi:MAG: hypothetical protein HZB16_10175 [Armatimonadetes bacterium]|nr:hypothetical protein [Armatimonadota bacterium]
MICPRCRALLPEPRPSCPGCDWSLRRPLPHSLPPRAVVLLDSAQPARPAERAWELFEAGGVAAGALLLIALAERRLELVVGLDWEDRVALPDLHAELRERVAPLLADGAVEPAVALAERLLAEAFRA